MDESDPNESNDDTNNDIDGRNESDNKLTQYMLINKVINTSRETKLSTNLTSLVFNGFCLDFH